jgi:hypothetical protein
MKLADALTKIQRCARDMNASYGKMVFDEWAVVSLKAGHERIVNYFGPRRDDFQANFKADLGTLRAALLTARHNVGEYDFARHADGTNFEAFVCIGDETYLICNNTQRSMDEIAKESRWLEAQKAFAELTEYFQGDALAA